MEFLLGFAGAFAFFLLFGAGVFCGWKVREHTGKVTAEQLTPRRSSSLRMSAMRGSPHKLRR